VEREFREVDGDTIGEMRHVVKDSATDSLLHEWPWGPTSPPKDAEREEAAKFYAATNKAGDDARAWLLQKYPLAEDAFAYWQES